MGKAQTFVGRPVRIGRFELLLDEYVPTAWLAARLTEQRTSTQVPRILQPMTLPNGTPVMFKRVGPSRNRHGWLSRLNAAHRLKPRFAAAEGRALQDFWNASLPVPRLLGYGEQWRFGIRGDGLVLSEYLPLPTVQVELARTGCEALWLRWFALIARIHAAGYAHGDCDTDNFLMRPTGELLAIDLEKAGSLTPKLQRKDVLRALRCRIEADGGASACTELLYVYAKHCKLPQTGAQLVETALGRYKPAESQQS